MPRITRAQRKRLRATPAWQKQAYNYAKMEMDKPYLKRIMERPDRWPENAWEKIDPTGLSLVDDSYRRIKTNWQTEGPGSGMHNAALLTLTGIRHIPMLAGWGNLAKAPLSTMIKSKYDILNFNPSRYAGVNALGPLKTGGTFEQNLFSPLMGEGDYESKNFPNDWGLVRKYRKQIRRERRNQNGIK